MFIYYVLGVILFFMVYPFLRIFIIRLWFCLRLFTCRNIKVLKIRPFVFYDFNKGTQVDLIVISGEKLYAIELFSPLKKRAKIILQKPNLFAIEKFNIHEKNSFKRLIINYSPDEIVKELSVNIFDYPEISYVESS